MIRPLRAWHRRWFLLLALALSLLLLLALNDRPTVPPDALPETLTPARSEAGP